MTDELKMTAAQKADGETKMRGIFGDMGSKIATNMFQEQWKKMDLDGVPGADKDRIEPAIADLGKGCGLLAGAVDFTDAQKYGTEVLDAGALLTDGEWGPVSGPVELLETLGHLGKNVFDYSTKAGPAVVGLVGAVHQDTIKLGLESVTKGGGELWSYFCDVQKKMIADAAANKKK